MPTSRATRYARQQSEAAHSLFEELFPPIAPIILPLIESCDEPVPIAPRLYPRICGYDLDHQYIEYTPETYLYNITSEASCQGQTNTELHMRNFVEFTVAELYSLLGSRGWGDEPVVMHKDKMKSLRSINTQPDGTYLVKIKAVNSRDYIMKGDEVLEMDILETFARFLTGHIFRTFGCTRKFRCNDWALGHYGTFINANEVFDSVRGRRHIDSLPSRLHLFDDDWDKIRQAAVTEMKAEFTANPMEHITCGFELETQATEGINRLQLAQSVHSRLAKKKMDRGVAYLTRWMRQDIDDANEAWQSNADRNDRAWREWLTEAGIVSYDDAITAGLITANSIEQIMGWLTEDDEDIDEDILREEAAEMWKLSSNVEVAIDESVEGFELRTDGPQSPEEFESGLDEVFRLNHTIDTRCSFHIHIQVKKLKHSFNRAQRQHLIRYLFENASRLPTSVITRWADHNANYFFMPDEGPTKMNFINFHQRFNTIEFRGFGNIRNKAEGMICLELAVEALADYYKTETNVFVDDVRWGQMARDTMETNDLGQLDKFAKAHIAHMEIARENKEIMDRIQPELIKVTGNLNFNFTLGA